MPQQMLQPISQQMPAKKRHPNLPSVDETHKRWQRFIERPMPALRDTLILQYAPLVKYVLGRLSVGPTAIMDHDDMTSTGTVGLIEAVGRFDPSLGVKFETYAISRIRGAMFDALRRSDRLSRSVRSHQRKVEQATEALREKLGREPEDREVASALGITLDRYQKILSDFAWVTVSLDKLLQPDRQVDSYLEPESVLRLRIGHPAAAERNGAVRHLADAIAALPQRDQLLLALYYQEELTQKEVGSILGISESRVCQLHARTLKWLRSALADQAPIRAPAQVPTDSLVSAA